MPDRLGHVWYVEGQRDAVEAGVPVIALVNDAGLAIDGARKQTS